MSDSTTKVVAAQVPQKHAAQLLTLARERDRPVSSEIRAAISAYLENERGGSN
jgi:hypothetical protein